ncbi:hypothetical protein ACQP3D_28210, partial [Escherichia coli]
MPGDQQTLFAQGTKYQSPQEKGFHEKRELKAYRTKWGGRFDRDKHSLSRPVLEWSHEMGV